MEKWKIKSYVWAKLKTKAFKAFEHLNGNVHDVFKL